MLVAWGFTDAGERVLLAVMLGMRESHEDWLALGRDLIARGLGAPMLIVAGGLSDVLCEVGVTDAARWGRERQPDDQAEDQVQRE